MGTVLAGSLGIVVPEPALVDVDAKFVATTSSIADERPIKVGTCFGSKYISPGMHTPTPETRFDTPELIDSAVRIYGFDLTFQNMDRHPEKVNCGLHQGRIVAFDFERAFEFTGWRAGGDQIPACCPNQLWIARKHIFRNVVSKHRNILDEFAKDIAAFDVGALERALNWMPGRWNLGAKLIIRHVRSIQQGFPDFRENLLGAAGGGA